MTTDTAALARTYFTAWKDKDFETLGSILADDVTFRGPLGTADNKAEALRGLEGMSEIMTDIVIDKMLVDGPDVMTWFHLHSTVAEPSATVNWSHVENGKISRIRVTFDARAFM